MMIWKDYNTMKDDFNVEWIRIGSTHCWDLPDYKKKAEDSNPISDLNQLKSDLSHLNRFQSPGPFVDVIKEAKANTSSCISKLLTWMGY
jgi:hypothetical protein